ncbi:hypothetical protein CAPN002_09730 [Capnocytophaga stomatis]|uniref:hypothetical protein n=1 Tax=Capnocytophaga stomatis TaxID=1848904 RepID=UPI001951B6FD|nr:hypothetical protein [Capnocytophaga stomatis]GIJ93755.1 hypothetical protein CAPN002_09730 [Capnocytophaga stomatis]
MENNLFKIYEYFDNNEIDRKNIYSKYGSWLGDVNCLCYPFCSAPDDIPEDYDYAEEIKQTNQIFSIFGFGELNDEDIEDIRCGCGYVLMHYLFKVRRNIGLAKTYYVSFSMMQAGGEFVYIHCNDVDLQMTYKEMILKSHAFEYETADETEKYHFDELLKFAEEVCKEIEIETEQNKGSFEKENTADEENFDELIRLLNYNNYLSDNEISKLKTDWKNINENRRAFAERLIDEGIWFEEDLEYLDQQEKEYLLYWAFTEKFDVFKDDWKFDTKELSKYISEKIGQPFKVTFKEVGNDWGLVQEKLENLSDYTLLDIASGNDDCNFIVAKKEDKDVIYALANELNIPIV